MAHIPVSNPFVTRLASLATDIIRNEGCQIIFAYYLEPYAIAGWLASMWTGKPLVIKHAGSDLDRLCRVPDLSTAYSEVLKSSAAVITSPALMPRLMGLGVVAQRLYAENRFCIPTEFFHPRARPLDINQLIGQGRILRADGSEDYDSQLPTIGVYGKIGRTKGTYDLVAALHALRRKGLKFNFLAMIGKVQGEQLLPLVAETDLQRCTYILPFLPNWRVPSFIRSCTAVCFLERDFPIAIHGPIVPREVMACGTCLVLSSEIASKQSYFSGISPAHNVILVEDPNTPDCLVSALSSVLSDVERAHRIGARGSELTRSLEDFDSYIQGWQTIFKDVSSGVNQPNTNLNARDFLSPALLSLLGEHCSREIGALDSSSDQSNPLTTALDFCDRLLESMTHIEVAFKRKLVDALKYQRSRLLLLSYNTTAAFPVSDQLHNFSAETVMGLRPVKGNFVRIEEFEYDVSPLFHDAFDYGGSATAQDLLGKITDERLYVLFTRAANLHIHELKINELTKLLVAMCNGNRTTRALVDDLCDRLRVSEEEREEAHAKILAALNELYSKDVIVFGEYQDGLGWAGGLRTSYVDQIQ